MKLIKVGAAVLNQTPRDWKGNFKHIHDALVCAEKFDVTVLCMPEATITGYGLEDDLFCSDVPKRAMKRLAEICKYTALTKGRIFCVGLPIRFNNSLYNAVATVVDGHVRGFTCKQHLAGDGIHYENRWYKPWPQGVVAKIACPELVNNPFRMELPIGDVHFNIGGIKIGYEICEDAWVANRPGTKLASKGIDIYLNPSASHFSFGKLETRKNFVVDGSRAFNATYVYTNLVGNEAGRAIYDGGPIIASGGKLLAIGKRFSFHDVSVIAAIVDIDTTRTANVRTASYMPDPEKFNDGCINVEFEFPKVTDKPTEVTQDTWEKIINVKHEECTRAIGLALMDYMRKSHTKGFVISLSGGADSAMCTYLAAAGIRLAIKELGIVRFRMKYIPWFKPHEHNDWDNWTEAKKTEHIIWHLITTAYQPTENSGKVTREAAAKVAEELNVPHYVLEIQKVYEDYLEIGNQIKGGTLNFAEDDLVLQNLQARVRAPGIWIIANMQNKLLLTTSNMSEAAVGYATMDGDTAGCLGPIAGLPKCYIREYLKWLEVSGPDGIGAVKAMSYVNNQQPTAELRPSSSHQTDEDDLMPYWLLHRIQSLVVKNRYVPVEIFEELKATTDVENNKLIDYITKFFRLFSRNQWKRERYALSFHMDDHNLDPRSWCRTPILTGGYEEELDELAKFKV